MAISFVGAGTKTSATATSIAPPLPADTAAGDILLIVCATYGVPTLSCSGYTTKFAEVNSTYGQSVLFWKRHTGTESDPTVTGATNSVGGQVLAFRGCSTDADPFDATAAAKATGSTASATWPALSTATNGACVIAVGANYDNGTATNASYGNLDAGFRSSDYYSVTAGSDCILWWMYGGMATAGSIGSPSTTVYSDLSLYQWVTHVTALKPAPAWTGLTVYRDVSVTP